MAADRFHGDSSGPTQTFLEVVVIFQGKIANRRSRDDAPMAIGISGGDKPREARVILSLCCILLEIPCTVISQRSGAGHKGQVVGRRR